ncbi:uncharacterized protein Dwil_GK19991 [Drosophila willistoni]|uniref:Uncharacterized protein n=1 Tax=Drosophila willistoni TaxID=7260 RepID=B4MSK2_DROWI|nr:uncharacterized protein Dwil_GK19991 [Drosophila willistoni]
MKLPTNWWLLLLLIPLIQAEPIESDDETTVGYNISESQSQSPQAEVISSQNEDRPQNTQQEQQDPEQTSSVDSGNGGQGNGNVISSAGARVEADVIDVEAANSKAKTGQTTRIYTTGEVDDSFWLKHLGDDFKHAIHLQVGGTNDDYHQLINQTNNGVHEEVHHEYLPGAERPPGYQEQPQQQQQPQGAGDYGRRIQAAYNPRSRLAAQLSLDSESMALKQHYLQQQHQQHQHSHQHQHAHPHPHAHPHQSVYTQNVYSNTNTQNYPLPQRSVANGQVGIPRPTLINSSEDTLHSGISTSNAGGSSSVASAASSSGTAGSSRSAVNAEGDNDSFGDQMLPFKSPFNDYGSRPTRDLTYLLYRRGL